MNNYQLTMSATMHYILDFLLFLMVASMLLLFTMGALSLVWSLVQSMRDGVKGVKGGKPPS